MTPAVLFLASDEAPTRVILGAGAGNFAVTHIAETAGVYLDEAERTPETIAARWAGDFRSRDGPADARRLCAEPEIRGGGGEGQGREGLTRCPSCESGSDGRARRTAVGAWLPGTSTIHGERRYEDFKRAENVQLSANPDRTRGRGPSSAVLGDGPRPPRSASLGRCLGGGALRFPCDRFDGGSRRGGRERCRRSAFRAFPIACGPFRGRLDDQARPQSTSSRGAGPRAKRRDEPRGDTQVRKTFGSTTPEQALRQAQGWRAPRGAAGEAGLPHCQTAWASPPGSDFDPPKHHSRYFSFSQSFLQAAARGDHRKTV